MRTSTYEITLPGDGHESAVMTCVLCGATHANPADIARVYCPQCDWFHEPVDPVVVEMENAIQRAAGEVATALELADCAGADAMLIGLLREAQECLRRSLRP